MSIWGFSDVLPPLDEAHRITLGEGNTPLVRSRRIGPSIGMDRLYFKLETGNPTGSYKDRFAACGVSHALALGKRAILATSSGNSGSALAAYCAAAQLPCCLAIVETAPEVKLRQMLAYGASLFRIRRFGPDPHFTQEIVDGMQGLADALQADLQISAFTFAPLAMAGVRTIAYELAKQMSMGLDHVFSPAGGGGLVAGVAQGFAQMRQLGYSSSNPAVHCVQPEVNNTIVGPMRAGEDRAQACTCTTTISGLQVAGITDGHEAIKSCRPTGGTGYIVSDELIYKTQAQLAQEEGIFAEPAGVTALAGALEAVRKGEVEVGSGVVCLVTGSGFNDESSVQRIVQNTSSPLVNDFSAFKEECVQIIKNG
tara:strand:- start:75 stop:1178 length:1104 start_codon:yes stop_codon:yes gene_type:complete